MYCSYNDAVDIVDEVLNGELALDVPLSAIREAMTSLLEYERSIPWDDGDDASGFEDVEYDPNSMFEEQELPEDVYPR